MVINDHIIYFYNFATMETNERIKVLLTGPTGTVGRAFLKEFRKGKFYRRISLSVLARDSRKNRKILKPYVDNYGVTVHWGDLSSKEDAFAAVKDVDCVLHIGGIVSPAADYDPDKTMRINVGGTENIIEAVKRYSAVRDIRLVYTGSVSQTGMRHVPFHWGRAGDPVWGVNFDWYAQSKIIGEKLVAESGLKHWVSLRLPGILSPLILKKGMDPITFHVPLRGVLEWVTDEDVARTLIACAVLNLPEEFWRNFYNVSSGPDFRMTNYEFMQKMLKTLHCPPVEKVFDARWFATDNFHGMWYEDSDELEYWLHFRSGMRVDAYFHELARSLPFYVNLAAIVPAFLIKFFMKRVATKAPLGPLYWIKAGDIKRMKAFFGGIISDLKSLKGWNELILSHPENEAILLDHGYDETKRENDLDLVDMKCAAHFRGGQCLSESMNTGDLDTPLIWECRKGHRFTASPRLILKGGHWCPECFTPNADYEEEAEANPFFSQAFGKKSGIIG